MIHYRDASFSQVVATWNRLDSFTELTVNSVWTEATPITGEASHDKVSDYGCRAADMTGDARTAYEENISVFKPGIVEFFNNRSAGHFRLNISDREVTVDFYPGDAPESARTFRMTRGIRAAPRSRNVRPATGPERFTSSIRSFRFR